MRTLPWTISVSVLVLGAADPAVSLGQEQAVQTPKVQIITDSVSCDSCVIERYKIATIHDRNFPEGALVRVGRPHLNADGTFLVIAGPLEDQLFLAESDGSIVRRIGRDGEGPGEYKRFFHVEELPAAYLVFDSRLNRVTRLSKTTFEVLGTAPFPPLGGVVPPLVFEDGSYLRSGMNRTREGVGHSLHLFDSSGRGIGSFGGREGVSPPQSQGTPKALASSRDGTFWVADSYRYRLELWDREGNLLAVYEREADWYPHFTPDEEGHLPLPKRSSVRGLWERALST